jgi:shikimate 5-dehydrogenase
VTVEGLEMFVRQGAAQIGLWTGRPAPVDQMRRVVAAALEKGPP